MKGKVFGLALLLLIGMGTPYARAQRAEGEQSPSDSLNVDLFFRNLPEVMVKGERPIAKLERGRLTYDMPLLLQRIPSDNALEALGNIPGVSVQAEKVNFAGQPVTLIINGKATTMDYSQAVERLKSMPADRLAKAEVMLSAPARYHVRGAAINIVTKDYTGKHVSGQLKGTYTQDRYASGNLQGNLLYADGKLTLDAGYAYTNGHGYGEAEHKALHPLGDERIAYADRTTNKTHGLTHYYRTALDYKMAEDHWLSLAYTGSWESHRSRNRTTGNSVSRQESQKHNYLHNVDFSYNLPFDLLLTASYTRYEAPKDQWLHGRLDEAERNLSAGSNQKIDKWLVAADQQHSLKNGWGISYGGKYQSTENCSFQTTRTADEGEILPEATSRVDITERIVNIYAGFSKQIGQKITVDGTIAVENFHTTHWDEWRVYPSVNAVWKVSDRHLLNLSFSSDATYPGYWSTMSSIHYSSTYSEIWGNPDLKPSGNYNLSLMWQLNGKYTLVAFADLTPDFFTQLPYQTSDRMAVIMKEVNFDHRNTYGLQASAQFRAGSWLNGNLFAAGLYTHDRCDDFFDLPFNRKKLSLVTGGVASARLSKRHDLRLTVNPFFQSDAIQGVYDIKNLFTLDSSLRRMSANGHWSVTASGHNLTNRRFKTRSVQGNQHFEMDVCQDWANGSLSVVYKFGNYKQKQRKEVDTSRMGY